MLNQDQFNKFLGEQIAEFRKKKELTLEKLIEDAGLDMSKATLSAIENGNQKITAFQLFYIGKALNMGVNDFFQDTDFSDTAKFIPNDIKKVDNI